MNHKEILIHTHLGMGDHFICNGLIRKFIKSNHYEKYYVACKKKNKDTVSQMFRDLHNVSIFPVENDGQVIKNAPSGVPILRIGHENLNPSITFDLSFYKQLGMDITDKRNYFFIERDKNREQQCFDEMVIEIPYIFVHDSCSSGSFDLKIDSDLRVVKPSDLKYSLTDYLKVIELADEIHCVDSSFLNMIDLCITDPAKKMYFHDIRKSQHPTISNLWKRISY